MGESALAPFDRAGKRLFARVDPKMVKEVSSLLEFFPAAVNVANEDLTASLGLGVHDVSDREAVGVGEVSATAGRERP